MATFIDDDTCEFGLAQTSEGCVRTLSSFCRSQYEISQIVYLAAGFLALAFCAYKYVSAVRHDGGKLQRQIFLLCGYASLTIMLRGIDPGSYGHFVPRALNQFFTDSCNATLYTIYIKSLFFYVTVAKVNHVEVGNTRVWFERAALFVIWVFYVASAMTTAGDKGFSGIDRQVRLFVAAGFLAVISFGFTVYGVQVIRQLEYMEAMNNYRNQQMDKQSIEGSCRTVDFSHEDSRTSFGEEKRRPPRPSKRIRNILIATQTAAFICIVAQVVAALEDSESSTTAALQCANGENCDKITSEISLLHVFQYVWVLIALWCYRTIQKRPRNSDFLSPQSEFEWKPSSDSDWKRSSGSEWNPSEAEWKPSESEWKGVEV
ncbi:hypothetical protein FI667_g3035, partial [Globisporangium splendens]